MQTDTQYLLHIRDFEGPLDLLLHLISTNELDIYDFPIKEITNQYMNYIYTMNELNIDLASEFIVMAAQLIMIKSKLLLPADEDSEEPTEEELRQELIQRLVEYKVFKKISAYIQEKEPEYSRIVSKEPDYYPQLKNDLSDIDISVKLLSEAMSKILIRQKIRLDDESKSYVIEQDEIKVEDKILELNSLLETNHRLNFFALFKQKSGKNQVIGTFLAILELLKMEIITLVQEKNYADIEIIRL